jgi:hypothetical protein
MEVSHMGVDRKVAVARDRTVKAARQRKMEDETQEGGHVR